MLKKFHSLGAAEIAGPVGLAAAMLTNIHRMPGQFAINAAVLGLIAVIAQIAQMHLLGISRQRRFFLDQKHRFLLSAVHYGLCTVRIILRSETVVRGEVEKNENFAQKIVLKGNEDLNLVENTKPD